MCEDEDFLTKVAPFMDIDDGATPLYSDDGMIVGWTIESMYE